MASLDPIFFHAFSPYFVSINFKSFCSLQNKLLRLHVESFTSTRKDFFFFLFKYVLYFKVLLALITALHNIGNIFTSVMRSSPEMLVQGVPTYAEHLSAAFPFVVHLIPVWHSWVNVTLTKAKGMF